MPERFCSICWARLPEDRPAYQTLSAELVCTTCAERVAGTGETNQLKSEVTRNG